MIIAVIAVALVGVVLFGVLREDLKKAKQGKESKFWEVKK